MILTLYNLVMTMAWHLLLAVGYCLSDGKLKKFIDGQRKVYGVLTQAMAGYRDASVCWFHAASLGEYNILKPVMQRLKDETGYRIVLTFFSSTGVEALTGSKRLSTPADEVFFLPFDTRRQVRRFLDVVRPQRAVFAVSEYWPNYLCELHRRNIPTYLVSALVSEHSVLLKWYGRLFYREALKAYTHILVLDERSRQNLARLGLTNVTVMGDPLFDTAIAVAAEPYQDAVIERFCQTAGQVLVVGSLHDEHDLQLISTLADSHRDARLIVVPHEVSEKSLHAILASLQERAVLYADCDATTDFCRVQVLVVDFLGALSRIYRYGTWAYVGGGFTPYLHSVIEATVYGLPVAFGPQTRRKVVPRQLMELGIGTRVSTAAELDDWFQNLRQHPAMLGDLRQKARAYTQQNSGATGRIVDIIKKG